MELEFTAEQEQLRDSMRAVLSEHAPIALARSIAEGTGSSAALSATVADLGWTSLTVPESCGGIGLGPIEAGILAEELGRALAPGALFATVTQYVPFVRRAASEAQLLAFLAPIAAGTASATLALTERDGAYQSRHLAATARRDGDSWVLDAEKCFVLEAEACDIIAVVARNATDTGTSHGGCVVAIVDASDATVRPVTAIDPTRGYCDVSVGSLRLSADRVLVPEDSHAIDDAIDEATVALALEMVGVAQAIFDVTLDYAKQREQFGVPIGSFQAIKHQLADMLVSIERARATSYLAALCVAEGDERARSAVSVAKAAAGDCQRLLATRGIQIHGGIGFTWEHDMHLYVKRLKASAALFGSATDHRARIADFLSV